MLNHPETEPPDPAATLFHALGDATRRAMVEHLARGPAPVSALAAGLPISLPGVMQHLRVLEDAGIVRSEKTGRTRICTLQPDALARADQWLTRQRLLAEKRLDRFGAHLAAHPEEDPPSPAPPEEDTP